MNVWIPRRRQRKVNLSTADQQQIWTVYHRPGYWRDQHDWKAGQRSEVFVQIDRSVFSLLTVSFDFWLICNTCFFLFLSFTKVEFRTQFCAVFAQDDTFPSLYDWCEVNVTIADVNDNAPKFEALDSTVDPPVLARLEISEAAPAFFSVYVLAAFDPDIGNNALIDYSIVGKFKNFGFVLLLSHLHWSLPKYFFYIVLQKCSWVFVTLLNSVWTMRPPLEVKGMFFPQFFLQAKAWGLTWSVWVQR